MLFQERKEKDMKGCQCFKSILEKVGCYVWMNKEKGPMNLREEAEKC